MDVTVHDWWALLRTVAVLNLLGWGALAWWLLRQRDRWPPDAWREQRVQLWLAAGYAAGCAWRCLLPVYDVPRIVMVDSFWSSVLVGRSVATVAELCFAAQWALWLRGAARTGGDAIALAASRTILPLIAVAEGFSWFSVLTTSNIGHVVEESLWAVCALLVALGLWRAVPRLAAGPQRTGLLLWGLAGLSYAAYLLSVDVPMYWLRWVEQADLGHEALSIGQGLADAATRWTVSHDWQHWGGEVFWMTAYFSVGVWASLALAAAVPWRGGASQAMSVAPTAQRGSRTGLRRSASARPR